MYEQDAKHPKKLRKQIMNKHHVLYVGLTPENYKTEGQLTHCPLIEIVPHSKTEPDIACALANFQNYTHIIVTSKSSVQILKDYVSMEEWKMKTTIAVGHVTAKYLEDNGIKPTAVAKEETAEGVIEVLKKLDLSQAFVFWPHAVLARPLIANYLFEKMIPYAECHLYETRFKEPTNLLNLKQFDEIVFTSPSTVDAFLKAYGTLPQDIKLTPIGPITEKHLTNSKFGIRSSFA
jgi:uroporphyrinogen-III synthase